MAETLGIIAGKGELPRTILDACKKSGRSTFVLAFEGMDVDVAADKTVRLGALSEALNALRSAGCRELVLAGQMKRPSLTSLKPDAEGAKLLKRLSKAIFSGDDALLKALVGFLEDEGFTVVSAESITGEAIVASVGLLTTTAPTNQQFEDIAKGLKCVKTLGELDIGQALAIEHGYILAVEGAEGTDALITRTEHLMREKKQTVLVKASKPGQETRVDMPTIGPETITRLANCGFAGVAVEAGKTLVINQAETFARANKLGIFVYGT